MRGLSLSGADARVLDDDAISGADAYGRLHPTPRRRARHALSAILSSPRYRR